MNKPFKIFDCANYELVSSKLCNFIYSKNVLDEGVLVINVNYVDILVAVPELRDVLEHYGLVPFTSTLFYVDSRTTTDNSMAMHVDGDKNVVLLWPVLNCKNTFTRFYDVPSERLTRVDVVDDGIRYCYVPETGDYNLIGELELVKPAIIDTGVAHEVFVPHNNPLPRITIAFRFLNQPRELLYNGNA